MAVAELVLDHFQKWPTVAEILLDHFQKWRQFQKSRTSAYSKSDDSHRDHRQIEAFVRDFLQERISKVNFDDSHTGQAPRHFWTGCGTSVLSEYAVTSCSYFHFPFGSKSCEEKKVALCSRRWPEDDWCCLVAAVVVLLVLAAGGIGSWHEAAEGFLLRTSRRHTWHIYRHFMAAELLANVPFRLLCFNFGNFRPGLPGYYFVNFMQIRACVLSW